MILVLDPDAAPEVVDDVVRRVEALGFHAEISRGDEQVVVALTGKGDPYAIEAAFADHDAVDVIPILSHGAYQRLRVRRQMMVGLVAGLGALTALAAGAPIVGFLMPPKSVLGDPNFVRAASRDEMESKRSKRVTLLGKPYLLLRLDDGRYVALSAVCTHMSVCNLEWSEERRLLVCPCHAGAFDVHGNVVSGPPSIPLTTTRVEVVDDDIFLHREA